MSGEFDWYIWIVHLLGDLFSKHIRVVWTVWIEEGTVWGYIYHIHLVFWNSGFSSYTERKRRNVNGGFLMHAFTTRVGLQLRLSSNQNLSLSIEIFESIGTKSFIIFSVIVLVPGVF
ncbi:hypothetical protein AAC387_Pa03g3749 [Persea americana]